MSATRVLALVGEVMGLLDVEEFFDGLVRALHEAVPSDWCAINEVPGDRPGAVSITVPAVPAEMHAGWMRYGAQNPLVERYARTRDGRAVRFSDILTRRELHRLEIYRQIYRHLHVEYQIAFALPSADHRVVGVALSRERRDFTNRERELLNQARPFLIQAYRNALAVEALKATTVPAPLNALRALGLTRRQAEVVRLAATGLSDQDIADELSISRRTVQKHLELSYRTLGVSSRSQAAQLLPAR